ncbi:MAG: hypothetical protein LC799_21385 [Actinobacteria bacterium]|nr:hypothetical protein [Actinomycetota bacterium]
MSAMVTSRFGSLDDPCPCCRHHIGESNGCVVASSSRPVSDAGITGDQVELCEGGERPGGHGVRGAAQEGDALLEHQGGGERPQRGSPSLCHGSRARSKAGGPV